MQEKYETIEENYYPRFPSMLLSTLAYYSGIIYGNTTAACYALNRTQKFVFGAAIAKRMCDKLMKPSDEVEQIAMEGFVSVIMREGEFEDGLALDSSSDNFDAMYGAYIYFICL